MIEKEHISEKVEKKNGRKTTDERLKLLQRRKKRIPIIEQRRLMEIPNEDKSFKYRMVSGDPAEIDDLIFKYIAAGYEIVDKQGQPLEIEERFQDTSWKQSIACQSVGGGDIGILMRIPVEWWEEDQTKKQRTISSEIASRRKARIEGIPDEHVFGEVSISD